MESSTVHGLIVRKLCPLVVGVWCLCSSSVAQPVVSAGLPEASNRLSSELLLSIDEAVELDLQRSFRVNRKVRSAEMLGCGQTLPPRQPSLELIPILECKRRCEAPRFIRIHIARESPIPMPRLKSH